MVPIPTVVAWTVGAAAGVALARFVVKEWRRVNTVLHPPATVPVTDKPVRERLPTLKRDPRTGVYRP